MGISREIPHVFGHFWPDLLPDPGGGPGNRKIGHFPRRNFILNFGQLSESLGKNAPPGPILEGGGPKWGPGGSKWVIFGRICMKNDPKRVLSSNKHFKEIAFAHH